ncbi:hypothetical protein GCM10023206_17270 [Acinetobacter puyangensis]|uniref:Uncharacterized protein n=1 Tax=Acinetobacter puyangensis TaxID=1096779 RepID=A0A240E811_9GAMM|nr:hypothetical protein [Acinetobacter puyangensis]SNX44010.1 hypothetical protein SAMN05421731_102168 [Acinetobacter puyangensis]
MKIGIFWYSRNQVIGMAHTFDLSDTDSLGLIDSAYTHVDYWEILRQQFIDLKYIEYEEIPRGRVIFNVQQSKQIVYMDAKLFKTQIAKQIVDFFSLKFEDVTWKKDPHYYTK